MTQPLTNIYAPSGGAAQATALTPTAPAGTGISFGDILDAINPLQHIPILSGLYRAVTGSTISAASQIAGDTLYGGLIGGALTGLAASVANVVVQQVSGADISQHVVATASAASSSLASMVAGAPPGTPLIADNGEAAVAALQATTVATQGQTQLDNALAAIQHLRTGPQATNAQYGRAAAFDAINKRLLKLTA